PKRGGVLTRASAWDPPVLDPRLTNSVGLFQIATLTSNRLLRYPFADEAQGSADLTQRNLNIELKITKTDYTTYFGRYTDGKWDGTAWGGQTGYAVSLDERTYQYMHSKSPKNYFRLNDPIIDELATSLRHTPDRAEQRAMTKKIMQREHDQVLRMWM